MKAPEKVDFPAENKPDREPLSAETDHKQAPSGTPNAGPVLARLRAVEALLVAGDPDLALATVRRMVAEIEAAEGTSATVTDLASARLRRS